VSRRAAAEHELTPIKGPVENLVSRQRIRCSRGICRGGASGGDDRRPVFQQMIERACDGGQAFNYIVVHSYSRFFREAFEQEFYLRKLAKHDVRE
jgi:DNA invertase Pin-like site-specific DNA recombinase